MPAPIASTRASAPPHHPVPARGTRSVPAPATDLLNRPAVNLCTGNGRPQPAPPPPRPSRSRGFTAVSADAVKPGRPIDIVVQSWCGDAVAVLAVDGQVDADSCAALATAVAQTTPTYRAVIIDLTHVRLLSVAGLHCLDCARQVPRAAGPRAPGMRGILAGVERVAPGAAAPSLAGASRPHARRPTGDAAGRRSPRADRDPGYGQHSPSSQASRWSGPFPGQPRQPQPPHLIADRRRPLAPFRLDGRCEPHDTGGRACCANTLPRHPPLRGPTRRSRPRSADSAPSSASKLGCARSSASLCRRVTTWTTRLRSRSLSCWNASPGNACSRPPDDEPQRAPSASLSPETTATRTGLRGPYRLRHRTAHRHGHRASGPALPKVDMSFACYADSRTGPTWRPDGGAHPKSGSRRGCRVRVVGLLDDRSVPMEYLVLIGVSMPSALWRRRRACDRHVRSRAPIHRTDRTTVLLSRSLARLRHRMDTD